MTPFTCHLQGGGRSNMLNTQRQRSRKLAEVPRHPIRNTQGSECQDEKFKHARINGTSNYDSLYILVAIRLMPRYINYAATRC